MAPVQSRSRPSRFVLLCAGALLLNTALPAPALGQAHVTTPKAQFGFDLGADYSLINNTQMSEYWRRLEQESERVAVQVLGESEEGREVLVAIVTSPDNHTRLEAYRDLSRRLTLAEGVDEETARAMARDGKAVVWIDGGLHATEVLGAQQLTETLFQLASGEDRETLRFLDDVIVLICCPNPDGLELVSDWYMRNENPEKRSSRNIPRLYQKYIGHDNNRDFYMITQKETEAVCRAFYELWFPQIVYNHHQTGPSGTVLFAPPFRDPFNYYFDPLVPAGIDLVGAAMHSRFIAEDKPGATMRRGASYSTWWNGGLRTSVYFHNMVGLLTETIGNPTPMEIPLRLNRQLPSADLPYPIDPQEWHFRQSVDYSLTANRAVIDVASRYRETFLFRAWRMGRNSIERGQRDHWTRRPDRIEAAEKAQAAEQERRTARRETARNGTDRIEEGSQEEGGNGAEERPLDLWKDVLQDPDERDARGYILSAAQRDLPTAVKFLHALQKAGIQVQRATQDFVVAGRSYPEGSFVIHTAQAFRPHILDMFEPQVYPNDIPYPGGAPIAPYDSAGWTLAYQMGVEFDRVLEGFDGPFERIEGLATIPAGTVHDADAGAGFLLDHGYVDSAVATNHLLAAGEDVRWLKSTFEHEGRTWPAGTVFIASGEGTGPRVATLAQELGLDFHGVDQKPAGGTLRLKPVRVGLWDRYGGSMPSGWTRWLLERTGWDFQVVYPQELDAGHLIDKFDALVFVGGAIPRSGGGGGRGGRGGSSGSTDGIPEEYQDRTGRVTVDKTIPQLKEFLEAGGTVVAIGSSTALAQHLDLPISDALVRRDADGSEARLGREEYYVPGSVLEARVDPTQPLAYGLDEHVNVYFNNSPVMRLRPDAARSGLRPVAWFDTDKPLRSGWAWGQHHLMDGVLAVDATVGSGSLFLFGPEINFRAQPHGTFPFLFNALLYGPARRPQAF